MREMSLKPTLVEALDAAEQTGSNWVMVPENITTTHQFELAVASTTAQQLVGPFTCLSAAKDESVVTEENSKIPYTAGNVSKTELRHKKLMPRMRPLRGAINGVLLKEASNITSSARVGNAPRLPATVYIATPNPPLCRKTPLNRLPLPNNSEQSSSRGVAIVRNTSGVADNANSSQVFVKKIISSGPANVLNDAGLQSKTKKRAVEALIFLCPLCSGICKNDEKCDRCGIRASCDKPKMLKVVPPKSTTASSNSSPKVPGTVSVMSPKSFYAAKLQSIDVTLQLSSTTPEGIAHRKILKRIPRKRQSTEPPECLTISSDDEGLESEEKQESVVINKSTSTESDINSLTCQSNLINMFTKDIVKSQTITTPSAGPNFTITVVESLCRSIRLGSFKVSTSEPFRITAEYISMTVNTIMNQKEVVVLRISLADIAQALAHFGRTMPMIIFYTTPECAAAIRSRLKMTSKDGPYYDPGSQDETQKRIIILPEDINDNDRSMMKVIFFEHDKKCVLASSEGTLREIDQKAANELLVRSTPPEIVDHVNKLTSISSTLSMKRGRPVADEKTPNLRRKPVIIPLIRRPREDEIQKVVTYPPPPQTGGITITSEDICCLEPGEFLNDVIIDFYLRYVVLEKLNEEDRKRTHVFSSFFYGRLTRAGPIQYSLRSVGEADDRSLPPAERRHNRVKTWTRHVDIFDKDFIIIPINENSHWYLAIICYPYLAGQIPSCSSELQQPYNESETMSYSPETSTKLVDYANDTDDDSSDIGASPSASESAVSQGESSQAVLENSDMPLENSDDAYSANENVPRPCILLFDSLHARNWNRVVTHLREYLKMEWRTKKKTERIFDSQTIKGAYPAVPQQTNYSDCGIYLLQFVDSFFETPISNYSLPLRDLHNWFSEETINNKRAEIRNIILKLQREQQEREEVNTDCKEKGPNTTLCLTRVKEEELPKSFFKQPANTLNNSTS